MTRSTATLTEEQRVAQAEERRMKKLQNEERIKQEEEARSHILPRQWVQVAQVQPSAVRERRCKVMTWNVRQYVRYVNGCGQCSQK